MSNTSHYHDLIIVGSGGGSMCAALYAASRGKKVLVLEKSGYYGGTTARSGGVMWIPNNRFMKRDGVEDSFERARTYLEALAETFEDAPGATPERRERFLKEAPAMIDFLVEQGLELDRVPFWPDYNDELSGGCKTSRCVVAAPFNKKALGEWADKLRPGFLDLPATLDEALAIPYVKRSWAARKVFVRVAFKVIGALLTGKRYVSCGAALQARLLQAALSHGVEIRLETAVRELLENNGRVTGVIAEHNGKREQLGASLGVIVGAGGFAHNQALRNQYQPGTNVQWSSAPVEDTGDMHLELQRIGAALAQMEEMVGQPCILPPDSQYGEIQQSAQGPSAKPHAILVDQSGQRYLNEASSYMTYCQEMLARNRTVPAAPSWMVFDSQYLKKYMLAGTMPGKKKLAEWEQSGFLKKGETVETLAEVISVEAAVLAQTVSRFNGFVDQNRDDDFHRGEREYARWLGDYLHQPSPTLGRIDQGPFYAVAVYPGDVGTYGGVVTDECARVLRDDGSAIEGLYAAGVVTASVMGRAYPGAGSSVGPALTFGFVAAKEALA